jgi:hypothetical protein
MSTSRTNYGFLHHVARAALWLAPVLFVAAAVAVLTPAVLDLQDNFWRYYSDDDTIRRDALDARARQTLWSHPDAWSGPVAARPIEGGPRSGLVPDRLERSRVERTGCAGGRELRDQRDRGRA